MATLIAQRSARASISGVLAMSGVAVKTAPAASGASSGPVEVQSFVLPWPASVNAMYRAISGRILVSDVARSWKSKAMVVMDSSRCFGVPWPLTGRLGVVIEAWPPNKRARDLDNLIKVVLDAGNQSLWLDDSQIDDIRVVRMGVDPDKKGYIQLTVFTL